MAEVIHTRKGKYQYKYEHTRKGSKVISRYMYPVDGAGDRVKPYQERVTQQTPKRDAQQTVEYYEEEVKATDIRLKKKYEKEDIRTNAAERHQKAQAILKNTQNYNFEYGVEKNGKLIKEGLRDKLQAMDYAKDHNYETSTYDRKAEHLPHYSKAGYEIIWTKKELKPEYKKEITKLLGKRIR